MSRNNATKTLGSKDGHETYYDLLKISTKASMTEIVQAYNTAKSAFSRDSMATYSLFSEEETVEILGKLEEAYLTLSNIDKKRDYDKHLFGGTPTLHRSPNSSSNNLPDDENSTSELEMTLSNAARNTNPEPSRDPMPGVMPPEVTASEPGVINGSFMRELREKRGLSVDDVARVTKIPSRFLKAIEGDEFKALPARVYLQGFVKNMATLYKIEPTTTSKAYLDFLAKNGV
jgi:curved DNA-binding protein CbpA